MSGSSALPGAGLCRAVPICSADEPPNSSGCEDALLEHLHHRFLWNRVLLWLHGFETGILSHNLCSSVHCKFRSQTKGRENERKERFWRYLLLMFPSLPYPRLSLLPFLSHQVIQVINAHVRKGRVGHKSLEGKREDILRASLLLFNFFLLSWSHFLLRGWIPKWISLWRGLQIE